MIDSLLRFKVISGKIKYWSTYFPTNLSQTIRILGTQEGKHLLLDLGIFAAWIEIHHEKSVYKIFAALSLNVEQKLSMYKFNQMFLHIYVQEVSMQLTPKWNTRQICAWLKWNTRHVCACALWNTRQFQSACT